MSILPAKNSIKNDFFVPRYFSDAPVVLADDYSRRREPLWSRHYVSYLISSKGSQWPVRWVLSLFHRWEDEAQKSWVSCPKSHSDSVGRLGFQPGHRDSIVLFKSLSSTAGRIHRKWCFKDTGCLAGGAGINTSLCRDTGVTRVRGWGRGIPHHCYEHPASCLH